MIIPKNATKGLKLALEYSNKRDYIFWDALKYLSKNYNIEKVLYPGSYVHISPSIFFLETIYVDNYQKTKIAFEDPELNKYIKENKKYAKEPVVRFHFKDYKLDFGEKTNDFDLLISLSAGFISVACSRYLKKNGLFLVDSEHNDAARAYISKNFELIGVFGVPYENSFSEKDLNLYFQTKKGKKITLEMVEEVLTTSPSKMSYKFQKIAPYYLFRKIS